MQFQYICFSVRIKHRSRYKGYTKQFSATDIAHLYGVDLNDCRSFMFKEAATPMIEAGKHIVLHYRRYGDYKEHLKVLKTRYLLNR